MSSVKYPVGTRLRWNQNLSLKGKVVENFKLPGDICVAWSNGQASSYDEDFLDEHCLICIPIGGEPVVKPDGSCDY